MTEHVRIGLVGAGGNTKLMHIPGFQKLQGAEIVSVCNRSRESGQAVADQYGIPKVYENWRDLIENPDTNAICIGTWPYLHCALTIAALESGKHVLTEARMAMDASEAHTMLAASREHPGLVAQIVPAPHTLSVDATIKELIADGFLGNILSVDMRVSQGGFIDRESPIHWRQDRDLSGYNIMGMGIWYEAMMRWVGPALSVSALTRVHVDHRPSWTGERRTVTVPDHVEILCELAGGAVAHISHTAVSGLAGPDQVWIFGDEGTLHLEAGSMALRGGRRDDDGLSEIDIPPEKRGGWRVEEEFVNAILGLEPVTHTTFEDGVRYMEFTEAVTRSSQSGQKIGLPL